MEEPDSRISASAGSTLDLLAPTIFHELWWLEIATCGRYCLAEVREQAKVVGRLPYYPYKSMLGRSVIGPPPLTHFLGPAIAELAGKPNMGFFRRLEITKKLLRQLPKTSACYVKCHRDVTDVLAFQCEGFRAGVQFTHEVHPQAPELIWHNLRRSTRNRIRRAGETHVVTSGDDPAEFMRFYARTIALRKGQNNYMDIQVHSDLIGACLQRSRGRIYQAKQRDGRNVGAIFCAWDNVSSYYLMTCQEPTAHSGVTSLLVWEAINEAIRRNLIFDFDGVASEAGARSASNFTAIVSPRYTATRESACRRVLRATTSVFSHKNFFY